jgi:hypothetical protein
LSELLIELAPWSLSITDESLLCQDSQEEFPGWAEKRLPVISDQSADPYYISMRIEALSIGVWLSPGRDFVHFRLFLIEPFLSH